MCYISEFYFCVFLHVTFFAFLCIFFMLIFPQQKFTSLGSHGDQRGDRKHTKREAARAISQAGIAKAVQNRKKQQKNK